MTRSSSLLFAVLLAFNLAMVAWWTWFQVGETRKLEAASERMARGEIEAAARELGAEAAAALPEVAASRRRMFLSEGATFALIALIGGLYVYAAIRRDHLRSIEHDRFLAGATHELKTPLATIQLLLESLRDERLPADKRARYLESGLLEARRLERGLTNVLTAAGLRTTGQRAPARSPGDFAADVRRALQAMQPRAEAAGIELAAEIAPAQLVRDADAMQLVLHNLLDNAVKYSPRGSRVEVALRSDEREAVLSVRDQGQGMDAEALQQAFTPFWRGRDSASGGTGLGLHLVRELVLAHGGSIDAASDGPGQGSEFTVRLPRRGISA